MNIKNKNLVRQTRIREKIKKISNGRYRLSIFRSLNNIYAQIIDDNKKTTILSSSTLDKKVKSNGKLKKLFQSLKEINSKLWVIENEKRMCEKNSDFTKKFIKLSRDIHFLNDNRAKIKFEINNHTGSKIKEIKEYQSY